MKIILFAAILLLPFGKTGMGFAQDTRLWATYYGGTGFDYGSTVATDGGGNVYLTGITTSTTSIASGGFQNIYGGGPEDAYLVKFDGTGNRLWATYYGGSGRDFGRSVTADAAGNIYLAGYTNSITNIALGGFQNTYGGGGADAFLVKFDAVGNRLWATYYGGNGDDDARGLTTDAAGNVYLAGITTSLAGIASGGFQNIFGGGVADAFLIKFDGAGNRLWATYYGGSGIDYGYNIITDPTGNVYFPGSSISTAGIASGGFQNTIGGGSDAFLVKFDGAGNRLWATYYGSTGGDDGISAITDASGNVYLGGWTDSPAGIASGGFQNTFGGGTADAFLAKFDGAGNRLWATYYGGTGFERVFNALAIDATGNVYLTGETFSPNTGNVIASGGFQNSLIGTENQFLVKFDPSGNRLCATYYGQLQEVGGAVAVDNAGNVYLAGYSPSTIGIASGGFQNTFGGGANDAYLVKFTSCFNNILNVTVVPTHIPCNGQCTGTAAAAGGSPPYTYLWNNSQTTQTASGLCFGNYTVTVTDGGGSTGTQTVSITQTTAISITPNSTQTSISENTGIATVNPSGGTPGYTYNWSTGQTTQTITGLAQGTYTATVTDANGCTAAIPVTILTEPIDCSGEIYLPNAFSPNNDGENDVLEIYFTNISCIKIFKLVIYDRWGEKVFETTDPNFKWDGGQWVKLENTAVFDYYMQVTLISGEEINKKGNVSLIR